MTGKHSKMRSTAKKAIQGISQQTPTFMRELEVINLRQTDCSRFSLGFLK